MRGKIAPHPPGNQKLKVVVLSELSYMSIPDLVLNAYGLNPEIVEVVPFGTGLINHTWKILDGDKTYILQKINHEVFTNPESIAFNIQSVSAYLKKHFPDYYFVAPLSTADGRQLLYHNSDTPGYYRMFPFVEGSHSIDVVRTASEAYEAAKQFGRFTKLLKGFACENLQITLPDFHDLGLRYRQFLAAIENGNPERIIESESLIGFIKEQEGIVTEFSAIGKNPAFKKRVTHHDTKISNVLFNSNGKAICVIDLDTVMPGYFFSDVGDMMRTYLSPVSEEEMDLDKISVRTDFYKAIVEGYCDQMNDELTLVEKEHFFFAGEFMIYMQALRFLTDHLNDDIYYGAKYEGHNLMRAKNQLRLLECLIEMKGVKHR